MLLADRLVLRAFFPRFFASLGATLAVHMAVECIDLANQAGAATLLRYPLRIPQAIVLVAPIAVLIGGCWSGAHLQRTGQLVALAAAGRGARRGLLALPVVGALLACFLWPLASEIAPRGLAAFGGEGEEQRWPHWRRSGESRFVRLGGRTGAGEYSGVLILELGSDGRLSREVEASRALRAGRDWELEEVKIRERDGESRALERMPSSVSFPLSIESGKPQHLTGAQLRRSVERRERAGGDTAPFVAERGLRAALVALCIPCLALGALVGVCWGERPGIAAAFTALVGLGMWALVSPCWALAASGGVDLSWIIVGGVPTGVASVLSCVLWMVVLK